MKKLGGVEWEEFTGGHGLAVLESALPAWLGRQRWFGAKTKTVVAVHVVGWAEIEIPDETCSAGPTLPPALFLVEVHYREGESDLYQVPLALSWGADHDALLESSPGSVVAALQTPAGAALLHDATVGEGFRQALLRLIESEGRLALDAAEAGVEGSRSSLFERVRGTQPLRSRIGSAEQSNTSIVYGGKMIMKLFRRLQAGENPDIEIGRFLTEVAGFPRIPPFLGAITQNNGGKSTALAMLQEVVSNEGDGWEWTLEEVARFYEEVASLPPPAEQEQRVSLLTDAGAPRQAREYAGPYLEAAALLGQRTAEMHLALATETDDEAFRAEPFTAEDMEIDARRIATQIDSTLAALKARIPTLYDEAAEGAGMVLSRRIELLGRARAITAMRASGKRIRIHGDYHLGQVLRARNDFVLLDFEGEPARTLEERRRKQCPLKDVAGMLRSFSYAAGSGLEQYGQRRPERLRALEPWSRLWHSAVSGEFLRAYRRTIATRPGLMPELEQADALLNAYLLEKALYELLYELNNRPKWVRIPLAGILALLTPETTA